ncbi:MAG: TolB family protein, partial [Bacteroidota bacterium]
MRFSAYCRFLFVAFMLLAPHVLLGQFYNGYQMEFGKNRVQYDDDRFWTFMRFPRFETFYYVGGYDLAGYVGRTAEDELQRIERLLDYRLDGRIQFIIYNKLSEAKQTNIGLETEEAVNNNTGGLTRIVGNKVFLYFNGNHNDLLRQLRAGIAQVLIDQIMYGGDLKDRIQNSALLTLPDWYIKGLVSYISRDWDAEIDNRVRDGVVAERFRKFNRLIGTDALYAGHAFWKYIVDTYTATSISNLLYMTRINRNVESGFNYVLGLTMKQVNANFNDWLKAAYGGSDKGRDSLEVSLFKVKTRADRTYSQLRFSPDGRSIAFVVNEIGRYKVYILDVEKSRRKRIMKGGYRSYARETDNSFPIVAWHPTGQLVAMIREKKGFIWYSTYTLATGEFREEKLFNFEKVLDFSFSDDGQQLVLSGVQKGQSDIFVFNLRTRTYDQITKDLHDDLHPRFINGSKAIVFVSDRDNDTLAPVFSSASLLPRATDIFYYDYAGRSGVLRRLSETPDANESQPMQYDSASISYLSDRNGIMNRFIANLDSVISYVDTVEHYRMIVTSSPQTDRSRSILQQDVNFRKSRIAEIVFSDGRLRLIGYTRPKVTSRNPLNPTRTLGRTASGETPMQIATQIPAVSTDDALVTPTSKVDTNAVDIDDYQFQSDFPVPVAEEPVKEAQTGPSFALTPKSEVDPTSDTARSPLPKQRNYETAFSSSYFVSQLDNTLLNQSYQLFTGGGAIFYNPGLNGYFKLGIRDVMEDYRISGGFKLSGDLNSNEYFLNFENLKKRLDKQVTFYRQSLLSTVDFFYASKLHMHEVRGALKWPFSDVSSLRGSLAYRNDRFVLLSTDYFSLRYPNEYLHWLSGRMEYVFDNTVSLGTNLFNGTRLKIFGEYYRRADEKETGMVILGGDFRY